MGWHIRKSLRIGPFRLNFSNSGISYSFGSKGARIRSSSRGTFVRLGGKGIFYEKRIGRPRR